MPGLTYLDLSGRQGTDKNVWTIAMTDVGLEAVLTLNDLRELRLGCTSIGVGIEGAKFAEVSVSSVTPKWLERIKVAAKAGTIEASGLQQINDDSLGPLTDMRLLREVDLQGTAVTEKGAAALRPANPDWLFILARGTGNRRITGITRSEGLCRVRLLDRTFTRRLASLVRSLRCPTQPLTFGHSGPGFGTYLTLALPLCLGRCD